MLRSHHDLNILMYLTPTPHCFRVLGWNKYSLATVTLTVYRFSTSARFLLLLRFFSVSIYHLLCRYTHSHTPPVVLYFWGFNGDFPFFPPTNNGRGSRRSDWGSILLPVSKVRESWPQQQCGGCWIIHIIDFVSASTFVQRDVLFIYLI